MSTTLCGEGFRGAWENERLSACVVRLFIYAPFTLICIAGSFYVGRRLCTQTKRLAQEDKKDRPGLRWRYFPFMAHLCCMTLFLMDTVLSFALRMPQERSVVLLFITIAWLRASHLAFAFGRANLLPSLWMAVFWVGSAILHSTILMWLSSNPLDSALHHGLSMGFSGAQMACMLVLALNAFLTLNTNYRTTGRDRVSSEVLEKCRPNIRSPFSYISFEWLSPVMKLGFQRPLQAEDIPPLSRVDQAQSQHARFERFWREELERPKPSLRRALQRAHGRVFILCGFLKLLQDLTMFLTPELLRQLLLFLKTPDLPIQNGVYLSIGLGIVTLLQSLFLNVYFFLLFRLSTRIRSALSLAIYTKIFSMSYESRTRYSTGELMTFFSVDIGKIENFLPYAHIIWSGPLQLIISIGLLYAYLSWSVFAGLLVLFISIPLNWRVTVALRNCQRNLLAARDTRNKCVDEVFQAIRMIKMFAWERFFGSRILSMRKRELDFVLRRTYLFSFMGFFWGVTPTLIAAVSYAVFSAFISVLTVETAFPALTIFNIIRFPITMFPSVVIGYVDASVSLRRIQKLLLSEETGPKHVVRGIAFDRAPAAAAAAENADGVAESDDEYGEIPDLTSMPRKVGPPSTVAAWIKDGEFYWQDAEAPVLRDINVCVHRGELVMVVGEIGSGKSTLLSAWLGNVPKTRGSCGVLGSTAYCGQAPWIQNETLEANVLFGLPYDAERFQMAISATALGQDLKLLPQGQHTRVGEKGITLSVGQKQRLCLARAIYRDPDAVFLDAPLAAVDAHVGAHIFTQCIQGIWKNKTRVIVDYNVDRLVEADYIIVIDQGAIVEQGRPADLLANPSDVLQSMLAAAQKGNEQMSQPPSPPDDDGLPGVESLPPSLDDNDDPSAFGRTPSKGTPAADAAPPFAEFRQEGTISWLVYKKYLAAAGIVSAVVVLLLMCTEAGTQGVTDWWLSVWSSRQFGDFGSSEMSYVWIYLGLIFILSFVSITYPFLYSHALVRSSRRLHESMLRGVLNVPVGWFDLVPMGRILNRFSKDQESMDENLPRVLRMVLAYTMAMLRVLILAVILVPWMLVYWLALIFFYRTMQLYYLASSRELQRLHSITRSPVLVHVTETIRGTDVIRAFREVARFKRIANEYLNLNQAVYFINVSSNRWLACRLDFLSALIICSVTLMTVFSRLTLSQSLAALVITYVLQFTTQLNWLVRMSTDLENELVSIERIMEYADLAPEQGMENRKFAVGDIMPPRRTIHDDSQDGVRSMDAPESEILWPTRGHIEFKDFSLRYRDDLPLVLHNINAEIRAGEKIGIVGRTGSGKSSLMSALFRLVQNTQGQVLIDGIDIRSVHPEKLRTSIALIPQDPILFSGTLRSNLDPSWLYTDDEVKDAIACSHIADQVEALEGGMDAKVLEYGSNFSMGTRQLICLARAILKKPKILVLDETTASVDVVTDQLVQRSIREYFTGATVLTIAHRLVTILDNDRIMVMEAGRIIEFDTPEALKRKPDGVFSMLLKESTTTSDS